MIRRNRKGVRGRGGVVERDEHDDEEVPGLKNEKDRKDDEREDENDEKEEEEDEYGKEEDENGEEADENDEEEEGEKGRMIIMIKVFTVGWA
jgi:hypothetical protein